MISDIKEIFESLLHLRIKDLRNIRLFKIGVVGTIGFFLQALFFEIFGLQLALLEPSTAATIGAELGIISNFILNNIFTFRDRRLSVSQSMIKKFLQFNIASSISLAIQWTSVHVGESLAFNNLMALRFFNVAGILIGLIFNYFIYTKFIWKEQIEIHS